MEHVPRWPVFVIVFLLVLGAILLSAAGGHTSLEVAALLCMGIGGVWAMSLIFYAIGKSEDADRLARQAGREPWRRP